MLRFWLSSSQKCPEEQLLKSRDMNVAQLRSKFSLSLLEGQGLSTSGHTHNGQNLEILSKNQMSFDRDTFFSAHLVFFSVVFSFISGFLIWEMNFITYTLIIYLIRFIPVCSFLFLFVPSFNVCFCLFPFVSLCLKFQYEIWISLQIR